MATLSTLLNSSPLLNGYQAQPTAGPAVPNYLGNLAGPTSPLSLGGTANPTNNGNTGFGGQTTSATNVPGTYASSSLGTGLQNLAGSAVNSFLGYGAIPTANAQTTGAIQGPQMPAGSYGYPVSNTQTAAVPGSASAAAAQQQSDWQKYFGGVTPPSSLSSQNYSINPPNGVINSSSTNANTTTSDALAAAATQRQALLNGTAGSNVIPSDSLYAQILNQQYNAKLYSPEQQQTIQQYNDTQARIIQTQLAARRQLQDLQSNGSITKDQAAGFLTESQRRSDAQLADLAAQQAGNTLSLQTLAMLQQNKLGALSDLASALKPTPIAPGDTLMDAFGNVSGQATGASPTQIMSTAMQLAQAAQNSGTMQYNSDGTPNIQPYIDQATSYYQTHSLIGRTTGPIAGTSTQQSGAINQPQQYAQTGNTTQDTYQYAINKGLPPTLAGAVTVAPNTGDYYISGAKTTGIPDQAVTAQAGRSGISYVPAANVNNIQQLDTAIGQMRNVYSLAQQYLTPGFWGRIKGLTTNQLNTFFQTDPGWANFNAVRLQAIDYLKGLAQGGGFRTTQSEIDTAANSLLSISDNLESANAKMNTAMTNINNAFREYLPTHTDASLTPQSSSGQGSSNPFSSSSFYGN